MLTQVGVLLPDRVGHVVDAVFRDGISVVAAPGGIGDDLLDGRSIQAGGDIGPGAAGVLRDIDLAGGGSDIDEFAEIADPRGSTGVGCAESQGEARVRQGCRRSRAVPISNQVSPWFVVSKTLPVLELIRSSSLSTGLTTMLA